MSSFSSLGIAASGLYASQRAMEVVANNIANVNTEGYSRQRVELVNARPVPGTFGRRGNGMRGMGVTIADVVRIRSTLADTSLRGESGVAAAWSARAEIMGQAERVLGPLGSGAPQALADFFGSWEELSIQPDSLAARRSVLQAGTTLAGSFRTAANELDRQKAATGDKASETVDEVNRLAAQVAKLNAGIADAANGQQSPNDLLDQRDQLLDRLASLTGATVRNSDLGTVDVFIAGRALVRDETVEQLKAVGDVSVSFEWEMGGEATLGGTLGGLRAAVDTLASFRSELDDVANDLRALVNQTHQAGYSIDASADPPVGVPGKPFFAGNTGAGDFDMNISDPNDVAASTSGAVSDGNHALEMATLRDKVLTAGQTGKTAEDGLHGLASRLGALASEANDTAAASGEILNGLKRDRASVSSVSVDEEMADMVRFQRSYEAAARLMTTMDEMLDRLVNSTGLVGR